MCLQDCDCPHVVAKAVTVRTRKIIDKENFVMITKDMRIVEVLQVKPQAAQVFGSYGMGCIHCLMAHQETVEEAAAVHGVDVEEMLAQLNAL